MGKIFEEDAYKKEIKTIIKKIDRCLILFNTAMKLLSKI